MQKTFKERFMEGDNTICAHCLMPIKIRNPSGYCDHLYYPNNCSVCKSDYKIPCSTMQFPYCDECKELKTCKAEKQFFKKFKVINGKKMEVTKLRGILEEK